MTESLRQLELPDLQSRHDRAKLELETVQLESELALISPDTNRVVLEAYGDLVDPREHLYDVPNWGLQQGVPYSQITDRLDGKYLPIFETEQDLAYIRGSGRLLAEYFSGGLNIQQNLSNYTIGAGFDYEAKPAEGFEAPPGVVGAVQKVINTFLDLNQWPADGEREAHERSREDGETFIQLVPDQSSPWKARARFIEPDQLRDPQGFARDLENWLGVGECFESSWSFGVHSRKDCPGEPLGYHIVRDAAGYDYDYIPAARMEHFKRNVPRNVKRGVSDFHSATQWLNHAEKVLRNTATGAAVQAAIAFIRQHAAGTTSAQASGLAGANAYRQTTQNTPLGGRTRNAQRYDPGTILDIAYGMEYKSGPMGSERAPAFINVIQAALRYCGIRWSMPEYMVSGDASNANFSSTLVAESPFVKAREADQRQYKQFFHSLIWKAVKMAWEAGFFAGFGNPTWEQIETAIDITVTPPAVATRDPLQRAQAAAAEIAVGTLSRETAIAEAGRDPHVEFERMQREGWQPAASVGGMAGPTPPAGDPETPPEPSGEFGDKSRLQWKRNVKAIRDVLDDLIAGENTPAMAKELLLSLGVTDGRADRLIADAQDNQRIDDPELREAIAEAFEAVTRRLATTDRSILESAQQSQENLESLIRSIPQPQITVNVAGSKATQKSFQVKRDDRGLITETVCEEREIEAEGEPNDRLAKAAQMLFEDYP